MAPLGIAWYSSTELFKLWLTRKKSSSFGSPLSGKQVLLLFPLPGRNPVVRGARACAQSWSG
eukprot:15349295-Heterocapsa_arctica.AAC.1